MPTNPRVLFHISDENLTVLNCVIDIIILLYAD